MTYSVSCQKVRSFGIDEFANIFTRAPGFWNLC